VERWKWIMGGGKLLVGNGRSGIWVVRNGKWENQKWIIGSGNKEVKNQKWDMGSGKL
jgi:hypothetical protein